MRLSLNPQDVASELWYYEEVKGIEIIHQIKEGDRYIRTDHIIIPWAMIRRSLNRRTRK